MRLIGLALFALVVAVLFCVPESHADVSSYSLEIEVLND